MDNKNYKLQNAIKSFKDSFTSSYDREFQTILGLGIPTVYTIAIWSTNEQDIPKIYPRLNKHFNVNTIQRIFGVQKAITFTLYCCWGNFVFHYANASVGKRQ